MKTINQSAKNLGGKKVYKWRLSTMLVSWLELINICYLAWLVVSYIEVLATHQPSVWNLFAIMLRFHETIIK